MIKNKKYKITKKQLIKELEKTNMPNAEDIIKRVYNIQENKLLSKKDSEIVILREENEILKKELIKECEEHQQTMLYADNKIKVLEKALELACDEIRKHLLRCDTKNERINKHNLGCVEKSFLEEARKEIK